jgi:hypothetical protein
MRDTIDMAREAGMLVNTSRDSMKHLEAFEALVRADELVRPCCGDFDKCQQVCMPRAAAQEREACAKTKAGKPRELKAVGFGTLLDEQQFCFDKGWREGAAFVRAAIRARGNT